MKHSRMRYTVLMNRNEEGRYTVTVPALPGCISEGADWDSALKNIKRSDHRLYRDPYNPEKAGPVEVEVKLKDPVVA